MNPIIKKHTIPPVKAIFLALANCLEPKLILTDAVKAAPIPNIIGVKINSNLAPMPYPARAFGPKFPI